MIKFQSTIYSVGGKNIIRLPKNASSQLPSRGQVMVSARINNHTFVTPLEPDGNFSHWFEVSKELSDTAIHAGNAISVSIEPTKDWPEPVVPDSLKAKISKSQKAKEIWASITPMARWEWIRWIRSSGNNDTRQKRLDVAISKMEAGKRRPCCWNRNLCTIPEVSKNGVLLEPSPAQ